MAKKVIKKPTAKKPAHNRKEQGITQLLKDKASKVGPTAGGADAMELAPAPATAGAGSQTAVGADVPVERGVFTHMEVYYWRCKARQANHLAPSKPQVGEWQSD